MYKRSNAEILSVCETVFGFSVNNFMSKKKCDEGCSYPTNTVWLPTTELIELEWKHDTSKQALEWANTLDPPAEETLEQMMEYLSCRKCGKCGCDCEFPDDKLTNNEEEE
jgi:hypothetical protein